LASRRYDDHVRDLRRRYRKKAAAMVTAITSHLPASVQWQDPLGGLYVWARGPKKLRTGRKSKLFNEALTQNVLYVPGEFCYADDPTRRKPQHQMRLSFGSASERNIREGIARLGAVLRNETIG